MASEKIIPAPKCPRCGRPMETDEGYWDCPYRYEEHHVPMNAICVQEWAYLAGLEAARDAVRQNGSPIRLGGIEWVVSFPKLDAMIAAAKKEIEHG